MNPALRAGLPVGQIVETAALVPNPAQMIDRQAFDGFLAENDARVSDMERVDRLMQQEAARRLSEPRAPEPARPGPQWLPKPETKSEAEKELDRRWRG